MIALDELTAAADQYGFSIRTCGSAHWQVCHDGAPLVNVWPTKGKYLPVNSQPGHCALFGNIGQIIHEAQKVMADMDRKSALDYPHVMVDQEPASESPKDERVEIVERLLRIQLESIETAVGIAMLRALR